MYHPVHRRQRITALGPANGAAVWVDDVIYFDTNREGEFRYIYRMAGNGDSPQRISAEGVNSGRVTVAPDGSRLAFMTDRDDSDEIYKMNPDGSGAKRLTENSFSDHPRHGSREYPILGLSTRFQRQQYPMIPKLQPNPLKRQRVLHPLSA